MTSQDRPEAPVALRQRAETHFRQDLPPPERLDALSPEDTRKMLHELHVHQIELEMQNEELRASQARLDAARSLYVDLYNLAPVGYCTLSEAGLILRANTTFAAMLGVDRGALPGQPFSRFVARSDADRYYLQRKTDMSTECQRADESQLSQSGWHGVRIRFRHSDGRYRTLESSASARLDPAGRLAGFQGMNRDVSERQEIESELLITKARAEKANADKSRFLAAASHDLRQPLSALALYLGALKSRVAPDHAELMSYIQDCVASLSNLLTDLLDVSKLEAGVVTPRPSSFFIDDLLDSLVSVHSAEARLKGLRFLMRPCGATVRTDQTLLRRLISNLIANAIAYTSSGGVLLACRHHQGRLRLEVWDTGVGIAADQVGIIFEEFKQIGDGARTRGSGLGLSIVDKIAKLLGLKLSVRSRPGRGSMFAVELETGPALGARDMAPSLPAPRRLKIALVDDNILLCKALVLALKEAGHDVVGATNGPELLERLGQQAPDIIITDYRLAEGENGFDVIEATRKCFGQDLPAFLITGDTDPSLIRSMADRGIAVHHKPLQIEALQVFIRETTERWSS